jgi:hypothetical protein
MDNFIKIYENALSNKLCKYFIDFFDEQEKLGKVWRGKTGTNKTSNKKVKDSIDLNLGYHQKLNVNLNKLSKYFDIVHNKFKEYMMYYQTDADTLYKEFFNSGIDNILMNYNNITYENYPSWLGPVIHKYNPPNQGYHAYHADWGSSEEKAARRMMIGMVYLNDVEEGGETEFFHQKVKIKPEQGTLVIWPAYFTHLHKGHPPISGSKYIMNTWALPL